MTLQEWGAKNFPNLSYRTIKTWVAKQWIVPAPQKVGKFYYCDPKAVHRDQLGNRLIHRI